MRSSIPLLASGPGQDRYRIGRPLGRRHGEFWRRATCRDGCADYENGWQTVVPAGGPLERMVRELRGYEFRETRLDGGLIEFTFPAGQRCFKAVQHGDHIVQIERDPLLRRNGKQMDLEPWMESWNESVEAVVTAR